MRLSFLILVAALPAAAGAAPQPQLDGTRRCANAPVIVVGQKDRPPARKLGELPPGQVYLTVDRKVDGCRVPVIVRYGVGAAGR